MLTVPSFLRSFRPTRTLVHRRLVQLVLALFLLASAVCGMVVVNAGVNDLKISRDRGVAVADVLSDGPTTLVRFRDDAGVYHQPDRGLKYPTGLSQGDRVYVDYQRSDTENVKVQGRGWTLSVIPALSVWVVAAVVTGALFVALQVWWRRGQRGTAPAVDQAGDRPGR